MNELTKIKRLVRKGEGQFLEFKRKANNLDKLMKELVAFANSGGGKLLIGVSDSGEVSGLKDSVDDEYVIRKMLSEATIPRIPLKIEHVKVTESKSMLMLEVFDSRKKPHFYRESIGKKGLAYIRIKDECVEASVEMSRYMLMKRKSKDSLIKIKETERRILKELARREGQTLDELISSCQLKRKRISESVVRLAVADVLRIEPRPGKEDLIHFVD